LKILLQCAQEPAGNTALLQCSAKEFLAAFNKHAPASLKPVVEQILRLLVSPQQETPKEEKFYTKLESRVTLQPRPDKVFALPVEDTISILEEACEFPPLFLCEADEKRLFELGVSLKFGEPCVVKEACEDFEGALLKDYPIEAFLQRTDVLRALVGVAGKATDVRVLGVAKSALRALTSFARSLEAYWKNIAAPEFHPTAANIARPVHAEHISISSPSMKTADWQVGTPGVTLSVSGAVEWGLHAASLADSALFYESKSLWEASLWAFDRLFKYPVVTAKVFDKLTGALASLAHTDLSPSICDLAMKYLARVPVASVRNYLSPESKLLTLLAEQVVFQRRDSSLLTAYLEELSPEVLNVLAQAKTCEKGLVALEELADRLGALESVQAYYTSLDLFETALSSVEFVEPSSVVSAAIELCCYSQVVSEDSSFEPYFDRTERWLIGLLYCPVEGIRKLFPNALIKALQSNASMGGFARGALRASMLAGVLSRPKVLQHLITHEDRLKLVSTLADRVQDVKVFVPWLELVQCYPELGALRHTLTQLSTDEDGAVLRTLRGLFSQDPVVRKVAAKVVHSSKSASDLALRRYSICEEIDCDPVGTLDRGELEQVQVPDTCSFSGGDVQRLVDIVKSPSIELSLKLAALDQLLVILLAGAREFREELRDLLDLSLRLTRCEEDTVVARKLLGRALQVAAVMVYNYKEWTRTFYSCSLDTVVQLSALAFHNYPPVRQYALALVYLRVFSADCKGNSFIDSTTHPLLLPRPILPSHDLQQSQGSTSMSLPAAVRDSKGRLDPITAAEPYCHGFIMAFSTELYSLQPELQLWDSFPSSGRVKNYVLSSSAHPVSASAVLGRLHSAVTNAETHEALTEAVGDWTCLVEHSPLRRTLLTETSFSSAIVQVLRIPPTNAVEERLWTALLELLERSLHFAEPGDSLLVSAAQVFTRSVLPFAMETRCSPPLLRSILRVLQVFVPLHGPVSVFNDKFLNSSVSSSSLLHFLRHQTDQAEEAAVLRELLTTLSLASHHLAVQLDIAASPSSQQLLGEAAATVLARTQALTSAGSFEHKDLQRKALVWVSELGLPWESYIWAVRWTDDRDTRVRLAAWSMLSLSGLSALNVHSTLLEQAFEVLLTPTECFGVKTQALAFLNSIAQAVTVGEIAPEVFSELHRRGLLSQVKSNLTETTAAPPLYFAVCCSFLENLATAEPIRVRALCAQLGIWECLVSLLRPGALLERLVNDRRGLKGVVGWTEDDTLPAVEAIAFCLAAAAQGDIQLSCELVETTHLLTHVCGWVNKSPSAALLNLLHVCVYNCPSPSVRVLETAWSYDSLADALDTHHSLSFRLAAARLLSSLLPLLKIGEAGERLCLQLLALTRDTEHEPLETREAIYALASLLKHSWTAKRVALTTGFANDLVKRGRAAASSLQFEDIRKVPSKTASKADKGLSEGGLSSKKESKDLQVVLLVLKLWVQGDPEVKNALAWSGPDVSAIFRWVLSLWQVVQRHESLVREWLETLSCLVSGAQEAKKACVVLLEGRQSLMSTVVEFASRPSAVSDELYRLALTVLGNLAAAKEARQLLLKCKFPQGLTQRLTTAWQQHKEAQTLPPKTAETLEFLSTLAFYRQGQAAIVSVRGALEVVFELFARYLQQGAGLKVLNSAVLLLRNLCFYSNDKSHLLAHRQALPLVLALVSSSSQKPQLRRLAVSTVWAMLHHNQHVKGLLKDPEILSRLQQLTEETEHEKERQASPLLNDIVTSLQAVLRIVLS
jgi:hypothetical protein